MVDDVIVDVGKAFVAFIAQLLASIAVGSVLFLPADYLFVVGATGVIAYLVSALFVYEFVGENSATNEIIGLYTGAYTLLASYVFLCVTVFADASLGVVFAAPVLYFFPAAHVKCELAPEHNEEHLVSGLTALVSTLVLVVFFLLI